MNKTKRIVSLLLVIMLIIGMIPLSAIKANALGEVLKGTYYAEAGETTTITCRGGAIYQQTHFSISGFGIGKVTKYASDGTVEFEQDIFGSYSYSKTSCVASEAFVFDMYYGSIEVFFTTSNVGWPAIETVANDNSLLPPVKLNENPLYLALGETQELFIEWTQPLYESEIIGYSSDNKDVATISDEGIITAHREGEATITVDYYFIRSSDGKALSLEVECPVTVVDDVVDKNTGLRFYYSAEKIEPGDTIQIGADYSFGDFTGMYYPGTVEWTVSNENVLKVVQTVDNITMVRVEAMALGECELSLVLDGEIKRTETINVTLTDDTLIKEYKDYLINSAVMTTLSDARDTCWDVINRYSSGSRARVAFMTCLKDDLGLSVITKEALAALNITSSTHQDTVDEAIDLLMAEICSSEEAWFSEGLSTFKKRYKNYGAFTKSTAFTETSFEASLAQFTSYSEKQIDAVCGVAKGFVSDSISMAELVSAAVMTVQYERDVVISLMNAVGSAPGGTSSDLYKGLGRLLWEMDNLDVYVAHRYLNSKMVGSLQGLIEDGLFYKDDNFKMFDSTVWKVATGIGKLIALSYETEGGVFADDYMKACVTSSFASTLYYAVINSDSASELEYSFKFYVPATKVALNSAIGLCGDFAVNCSDLKGVAEGYLLQIDQTCTYENLLAQCRLAVQGASNFKSNVYMEDGEIVVDAYWQLPEVNALMLTDEDSGDFYTTGYTSDQLIVIPSHINGEKVTGVAANGFKGIANKYGIALPDSVVKIGDSAFSDCPQVTFIVLGDNLKEIGAYAFNNNYALQAVNLPSSLEIIKEGAFNNCYNISSIITDATQIDSKAFNNCKSLSSVTIKNRNAVISADAFDNCSNELTIYGYKNTDAEKIASAKGYAFVELSETVSAIEIVSPASKTSYEVGETIDTDGMTLNVTYLDGTTEVVSDGWVAYGDTSAAGEVAVKIYYGEKSATYDVTVEAVEVESVELEYTELTMLYGGDLQLAAQALPGTSKNVKIVWETSNSEIVAIDSNGFIEAIGIGTATITARALGSDVSATCAVTVVDTKDIDPAATTEDFITFTARENGYYVFYSTNSGEKVTGSILDINGNTLYTNSGTNFRVEGQLHKDKTYTLKTATYSSNNEFKVTINKSVSADGVFIKDSKGKETSEITGFPNDTKNLYYGFTPVNYITETCTWESSDTTIATVNSDGKVSFVAPGTAIITVTSENGLTDTCSVVVKEFTEAPAINVGDTKTVTISELDEVQYFSFTPEKDGWYAFYSLEDANGRSHYGTLYKADGTYIKGGISYSSDIAYIEYEFTAGETYIIQTGYVSSYTGLGIYEVSIKELHPAQSISIEQGDSLTRYPYASIYLSYTFDPSTDIIPETVTWISSDTDVATVSSSGYVSTKKAGTTTITITSSNGLTDEIEIVVEEFPEILCGEQKTVVVDDRYNRVRYKFTPEETGWYALYSISEEDTYGYLYDANNSRLAYDNDSGDSNNFRVEYQLQQGVTYYYVPTFNSTTQTGSFDIKLEKMNSAESIEIENGEGVAGYLGHTINLSVQFLPEGSIEETLTWTSSDESIATVDANGSVKLLAVGQVDITAETSSGLSDSCSITITEYPLITAGETKTATIDEARGYAYFRFIPENDGEFAFFALSSDFTCGYLNDAAGNRIDYDNTSGDGNPFWVQASLTAGETYVLQCRYYSSTKTGSFDVRLIEIVDAESIQITDGDTLTGYVGSYYSLSTELFPEYAREETLTWTSSDDSIVSVDEYGGLELLKKGTATITVTTEKGLTDSIEVSVTEYPEIQLDEVKTVEITETKPYEYFKFTPAENGTYIFAVDSDYYAELYIDSADGSYIGSGNGYDFKTRYELSAGTTYYITAGMYRWDATGSYSLKVTKAPAATSMEIGNGESMTAFVGENKSLWVSFTPYDCIIENVTWVSDNESVVSVGEYGKLEFIGVGTAIVTATSENGLTDSITIRVSAIPGILCNEEIILTTDTDDGVGLFSFVPAVDGTYSFFSYDNDMDTYGYILDANMNVLKSDDDGGDGNNFNVTYSMTAGTQYYLKSKPYFSSSTGEYSVKLTQLVPATSINISPDRNIEIFEGIDYRVIAELAPENSISEAYTWNSSSPNVATIDSDGNITPLTTGTTTITVTSENGLTDTITVTVHGAVEIGLSETKTGTISTGVIGSVFTFTPSEDGQYAVRIICNQWNQTYIKDSNGDWLNNNSGYNTTISANLVAGEKYYLCTSFWDESDSGDYTISVEKLVPATSMEISSGDSITRYVGSSYYLSTDFGPDNAIIENVTWESSNTSVATVTNGGRVDFIAAGTATITATSQNGLTDSIEVVVKAPTVMTVGETKTGFADLGCAADIFEFTPTEDGVYRVTVESPNHSYLNIRDSEGNYLANKGGYDMTADQAMTAGSTYRFEMVFADPNLSGNFTIKVEKLVPATGIEIVQGEMISGYEGGGYWSLSVKFVPDNAAPEAVTWTSDTPTVATVDDQGRVSYVTAGTATITATSQNGYTDTITVVVKAYPVLTEETPCDVTIENNEDVYMRFVPETSGNYRIYYTNLSYDGNRPHFVLEQNNSWLKQGDEYLDCYLEADTEYLIGTWFSSYSPPGNGSYTVCIAEIGAAESMQIDQGDTASGFKGEIIHLSATFSPEICMQESVFWTSSNNEVATVAENGRVNMISVGTAIITATSENGLTDTITITVKGYPAIQEGTETDALIDVGGMSSYFSFTPEEDGYYAFYASTDSDTYGYIMDEELNILASDDDNGEGYNFKVKYQMEAGKTYILKARYYGSEETGTIKVCVEKTRYIASLEVTALPTRLDYVKEHVYNISYKGLKLKATWSDGSVSNWSCNSDGYFNNMIEDEYISFDTDNCETSGEIIVSCGGQTTSFHINLVDNPVDHIEVVSPSSHKYVENYNGYEMNGGGYYYYANTPTDAVIKIVYLDGSSVTANVGDVVDYYSIGWEHNQYDKAWVVGTENESTVTYLGHTVNLPITVEENKVESIEVVSGKVTCIENAYGYDMGNGYYYYYSVPSDVTVKVNYTDGSSITTNIHDEIDGYSFNWTTDQYSDPWTLGDDNYVTISYLGVTGKLPVSVIASPVERIEINIAPTREYIYGDSEWGWLYSDGGYEFYPSDMTGISFTVYYTDGTTKTFTSADIDDQDLINGYGYSLSYDEYVSEPGDFPVTFSYMGKSAEYTIKLKESTVESLSVTKLPSTTQFGSSFAPDFIGAEFTITFADGSTKSVILTDSNIEYEYDWEYGLTYRVDVDGHVLSLIPIYAESGKYYRASYIDQSVDIRGISFTDEQEISSVVLGNVTSTGNNMNVTVTYEDGSTESLSLNVAVYDDYGDEIEGYAKTEKGMLFYGIVTNKDTNGDVIGYEVRILGHIVDVEAISVLTGDVNSDGTVDSLDRLILSRYLANWEGYSADIINMDAADVNNDGAVDSLDRLILSRHLANWSGYETLPFAS